MSSKILGSFFTFLAACLVVTEGMSLRGAGVEPRCRCIGTESRRIGKLISRVELFSPNPHCKDTEIIATLKDSGEEICLDSSAPWVRKVIDKILSR
ncbi:interleukin-8-like [Clupea harengus]|uniref:Interleukin-8-like n=1 Tax=Clupea harengus TaxID=7950 RepID=A0A6P8EUI7_CLUHA|nr:interleukin-8-like [Clupea harengus]